MDNVFQIHFKEVKKEAFILLANVNCFTNAVRKGVSAKAVCSDALESKLMSCQVKPPRTKCKHWLLALEREKMITLQLRDRRGERSPIASVTEREITGWQWY